MNRISKDKSAKTMAAKLLDSIAEVRDTKEFYEFAEQFAILNTQRAFISNVEAILRHFYSYVSF